MMVRRIAPFALVALLAACGGGAAPSAPSAPGSPAASAAPSASAKPAAPASAKPAASASTQPAAPASAIGSVAPGQIVVTYPAIVTDQLPSWLADDSGIFKKHGLNIDQHYVESSTGLAALLAGQSQIYEGGTEVLSAEAQGAADVHNANELKGKKVGVSRFGSASDIGTRLALKKLGLDPDKDVSVVQVGSESNRISAMQSGALQAGVAQPPANFIVEAKGFNPLLDLAAAKIPGALGVIATKRSYATQNRDVIQKFTDSIVEAIALQKRDPATATKILGKYLKLDDQALLDKALNFYNSQVLPDYPYPINDWVPDTVQFLSKENPKVGQTDFSKLFDRSFVEDAQKRGVGKS